MKKLTAEQIEMNWQTLIDLIEKYIGDDRKENLLKMYEDLKDRMMFAPASAKGHYHNAMPGGYVEHILHIIDMAKDVKDTWYNHDAKINFTDEELVFAAMHHDLGKVGDLEHDYYIPQTSDWHRLGGQGGRRACLPIRLQVAWLVRWRGVQGAAKDRR